MKTIAIEFESGKKSYHFNTLDDNIKCGDYALVYSLDRYSIVEVVDILDDIEKDHTGIVGIVSSPEEIYEKFSLDSRDFFDISKIYKAGENIIKKNVFKRNGGGYCLQKIFSYMLKRQNEYFLIDNDHDDFFAGAFTERQSENDIEITMSLVDKCYLSIEKMHEKIDAIEDLREVEYREVVADDFDKKEVINFIKENQVTEDYGTKHIIRRIMNLLQDGLKKEFIFLPVCGSACEDTVHEYYDDDTEEYTLSLLNENKDVVDDLYSRPETYEILANWQEGYIQKLVPTEDVPDALKRYVTHEVVNLCYVEAVKLFQSYSDYAYDDEEDDSEDSFHLDCEVEETLLIKTV